MKKFKELFVELCGSWDTEYEFGQSRVDIWVARVMMIFYASFYLTGTGFVLYFFYMLAKTIITKYI